jgi:hypothetical protein
VALQRRHADDPAEDGSVRQFVRDQIAGFLEIPPAREIWCILAVAFFGIATTIMGILPITGAGYGNLLAPFVHARFWIFPITVLFAVVFWLGSARVLGVAVVGSVLVFAGVLRYATLVKYPSLGMIFGLYTLFGLILAVIAVVQRLQLDPSDA